MFSLEFACLGTLLRLRIEHAAACRQKLIDGFAQQARHVVFHLRIGAARTSLRLLAGLGAIDPSHKADYCVAIVNLPFQDGPHGQEIRREIGLLDGKHALREQSFPDGIAIAGQVGRCATDKDAMRDFHEVHRSGANAIGDKAEKRTLPNEPCPHFPHGVFR